MRDSEKMICSMAMVLNNGLMDHNMMEIIRMDLKMGMENFVGKMGHHMKEILRIIIFAGKGNTNGLMEKVTRVSERIIV